MSRFAEDAATRIVRSLSTLIEKKLTVIETGSDVTDHSVALTRGRSVQFGDALDIAQRNIQWADQYAR